MTPPLPGSRSDVRPEAQDGESPAVFAQQQPDLIVVRVGVQRSVVLLVLHLVLRGLAAPRPREAGLRGARFRRALLPPLGAPVLEPHLDTAGMRLVHVLVVYQHVGNILYGSCQHADMWIYLCVCLTVTC